MSVKLDGNIAKFSFAFCVTGKPASFQSDNTGTKQSWKSAIESAIESRPDRPHHPYTGSLHLTMLHFTAENPSSHHVGVADWDNIVKPLKDYLQNILYLNDRQCKGGTIHQLWIDGHYRIRGCSPLILEHIQRGQEFIYIHLESIDRVFDLSKF